MAIIKQKDVMAWKSDEKILCLECGDSNKDIPIITNYFEDGDIVICDNCKKRILSEDDKWAALREKYCGSKKKEKVDPATHYTEEELEQIVDGLTLRERLKPIPSHERNRIIN